MSGCPSSVTGMMCKQTCGCCLGVATLSSECLPDKNELYRVLLSTKICAKGLQIIRSYLSSFLNHMFVRIRVYDEIMSCVYHDLITFTLWTDRGFQAYIPADFVVSIVPNLLLSPPVDLPYERFVHLFN